MLGQYLSRLWKKRIFGGGKEHFDVQAALVTASELFNSGDSHHAIEKYQEVLAHDPSNLIALNDLSSCLANIGNNEEAQRLFDLALALDDTFLPVLANRAKLLMDQRQSEPARELLIRAKVTNPFFSAVDGVYQGILFQHGDTEQAINFMRKTWLASFDQLRMANGYLFSNTYRDIDEKLMAQEHRFWADTLAPLPPGTQANVLQVTPKTADRRIRIGYLSPDIRDHSVRFFFRPLLENHDVTRFEVFLYHDAFLQDDQTALMRAKAEHFHDVAELPDSDLMALLHSHELDILVDLAGQTSYNRMHIFQRRHARIQINAIGYPPTTGLATMDYKLIDQHVWTDDYAHYYTEAPLVLPGSFWCYDPMVDVPEPVPPPCTTGKPLVFGCVGNVAKITDRILACWGQILQRVPQSKLLVRSVSFQDDAVADTQRQRFEKAGIDMTRVELRKPEGGAAYFASYNDIDIVLDTFPFNGGTTTSFAVYMGVPVVTWAGHSLVSRMGLSIMRNMGMPEAVAHDAPGYVAAAVRLSTDYGALTTFRARARRRLREIPLGNGKLFAQDFETACAALVQGRDASPTRVSQVAVLPARDLVKRAYAVLLRGQTDAAQRIVDYALKHYPRSANACILQTQMASDAGKGEDAIATLAARLPEFAAEEQCNVRLFLANYYIKSDEREMARQVLAPIFESRPSDTFDRVQLMLFSALLNPTDVTPELPPTLVLDRVLVICVGDDVAMRERAVAHIRALALPDECILEILQVTMATRIAAYQAATIRADVAMVVVLHQNVQLTNPHALFELANGLQHSDVLSFAGAQNWDRFDWRGGDFAQKTATYLVADQASSGSLELRWVGQNFEKLDSKLAVLDGALLVFRPTSMKDLPLDPELRGAGVLVEEDWVHAAHRQGRQLAVLRTLGVLLNEHVGLDNSNHTEAYLHLVGKWGMTVFSALPDDLLYATLTLRSVDEGCDVCRRICTANE